MNEFDDLNFDKELSKTEIQENNENSGIYNYTDTAPIKKVTIEKRVMSNDANLDLNFDDDQSKTEEEENGENINTNNLSHHFRKRKVVRRRGKSEAASTSEPPQQHHIDHLVSDTIPTISETKMKAMQAIHSQKVRVLLRSINNLKEELQLVKSQNKDHRRSTLIQSLRDRIREQDKFVDIFKDYMAEKSGWGEERINDWIISKTTAGPKRFRPRTREELANELIALEKKYKKALEKIKKLSGEYIPQGERDRRRSSSMTSISASLERDVYHYHKEQQQGKLFVKEGEDGEDDGQAYPERQKLIASNQPQTPRSTASWSASAGTNGLNTIDMQQFRDLIEEVEELRVAVRARDVSLSRSSAELEKARQEVREKRMVEDRLHSREARLEELKEKHRDLQVIYQKALETNELTLDELDHMKAEKELQKEEGKIENQALKAQCLEQMHQVRSLLEREGQLQEELSKVKMTVLSDQYTSNAELKARESTVENLQKDIKSLTFQKASLEGKLANISKEKEAMIPKIEELKLLKESTREVNIAKKALEIDLKKVEVSLAAAQMEVSTKNNEINTLQTSVNDMDTLLKEMSNDLKECKTEKENCERFLAELKEDLNRNERERTKLNKALQKSQENEIAQLEEIQTNTQLHKEVTNECNTLKEELNKVRKIKDEVDLQLNNSQTRIKDLEGTIEAKQTIITELEKSQKFTEDKMNAKEIELEKDLKVLQKDKEEIQISLREATEKLEANTSFIDDLQGKLHEVNSAKEETSGQLNELRGKYQILEKEKTLSDEKAAVADIVIDKVTQESERYRQELIENNKGYLSKMPNNKKQLLQEFLDEKETLHRRIDQTQSLCRHYKNIIEKLPDESLHSLGIKEKLDLYAKDEDSIFSPLKQSVSQQGDSDSDWDKLSVETDSGANNNGEQQENQNNASKKKEGEDNTKTEITKGNPTDIPS